MICPEDVDVDVTIIITLDVPQAEAMLFRQYLKGRFYSGQVLIPEIRGHSKQVVI